MSIRTSTALTTGATSKTVVPFAFNIDDLCEGGVGAIVEGEYVEKAKHNIQDSQGKYFRFYKVKINVTDVTKRNWDKKGTELKPKLIADKKVKTGYLNSSYDTKDGSRPDAISTEQFQTDLNSIRKTLNLPQVTDKNVKSIEFFAEMNFLKDVELNPKDKVRITTKGDTLFIENFAVLNAASASNFVGDTNTWTDNIMNMEAEELVQQGCGDGEDEWSD